MGRTAWGVTKIEELYDQIRTFGPLDNRKLNIVDLEHNTKTDDCLLSHIN